MSIVFTLNRSQKSLIAVGLWDVPFQQKKKQFLNMTTEEEENRPEFLDKTTEKKVNISFFFESLCCHVLI